MGVLLLVLARLLPPAVSAGWATGLRVAFAEHLAGRFYGTARLAWSKKYLAAWAPLRVVCRGLNGGLGTSFLLWQRIGCAIKLPLT